MTTPLLVASLMVVLGSLLGVIAWAAGGRRLRPNSALGIRTASTQVSDEAWYSGQAAAASWTGRAAGALLVGGLVLLALVGAGATLVGFNLVALPIFGLVIWLFVRSVRAADEAAGRAHD